MTEEELQRYRRFLFYSGKGGLMRSTDDLAEYLTTMQECIGFTPETDFDETGFDGPVFTLLGGQHP